MRIYLPFLRNISWGINLWQTSVSMKNPILSRYACAIFSMLFFPTFLFSQFVEIERLTEPVTCGARHMLATDLNADSVPDLVVYSSFNNELAWFTGNGKGAFLDKRIISDKFEVFNGMISLDYDDDGDQDLVLNRTSQGNSLALLENTGDGNFRDFPFFRDVVDAIVEWQVVDYEEDGDQDLLVTTQTSCYLLRNDKELGAELKRLFFDEELTRFQASVVLDREGDGDLDVLFATENGQRLRWLEQTQDTFIVDLDAPIHDSRAYRDIKHLYAVDYDSDQDKDIFVLDLFEDGPFFFYQNEGNGEYSLQTLMVDYGEFATNPSLELFFEDVNQDDMLDYYSYGLDQVALFSSNSEDTTFHKSVLYERGIKGQLRIGAKLDLNDDGHSDFVAGNDNDLFLFERREDGFRQSEFKPAAVSLPTWPVINDLDSDGRPDVITGNRATGQIYWFKNQSDSFDLNLISPIDTTTGPFIQDVQVTDLNGDDQPDILSVAQEPGVIFWYRNQGGGAFSDRMVLAEATDNVEDILPVDLDQDGDQGFLASSPSQRLLYWYEWNDDELRRTLVLDDFPPAIKLLVSDADGDMDLDILFVSRSEQMIGLLENTGNTQFESGLILADNLLYPLDIALADIDGDQDLDVLYSSIIFSDGAVYVIENLGESFSNPRVLFEVRGAGGIYPDDVDGDQDEDLYITTTLGLIFQFINEGNGQFSEPELIDATGFAARAIEIIDFDQDGDKDLLTFDGSCDVISLLDNREIVSDLKAVHTAPALFNVQPNPFRDNIVLSWNTQDIPTGETYRLELFSGTGQLLRSIPLPPASASIPTNQLSKGVYYFRIVGTESGLIQAGRLLKQ